MSDDSAGHDSTKYAMHTDPDRDFGALVGWTAQKLGDRIVLKLQSAREGTSHGADLREFTYYLRKEEAVLLGNFLYQMAGETPPRSRPLGKLARMFGKPN